MYKSVYIGIVRYCSVLNFIDRIRYVDMFRSLQIDISFKRTLSILVDKYFKVQSGLVSYRQLLIGIDKYKNVYFGINQC